MCRRYGCQSPWEVQFSERGVWGLDIISGVPAIKILKICQWGILGGGGTGTSLCKDVRDSYKRFCVKNNLALGGRKLIQGNNIQNTASVTMKQVSPLGGFHSVPYLFCWMTLGNKEKKVGVCVCVCECMWVCILYHFFCSILGHWPVHHNFICLQWRGKSGGY